MIKNMNILEIGLDTCRGVGQANEYQLLRQGNQDANLGMNLVFSTATSFQLIGITLSKINTVIENIKWAEISPIPTYINFSASVFIPCTITYIKKSINFTSHPNLHTIIKILDYQVLPNVILVGNLVAAIGLIAIGNPIYGGSNLAFLLLNLFDEQGWVNANTIKNNLILKNTLLTCKVSYLLTTLNLYNVLSLINIIADIIYQITCYTNKGTNVIYPITLEEFESKCSVFALLHYRLNNYHLLEKPISNNSIPDFENQFEQYASLLEDYLKQELSIYSDQLSRIFQDDEKWQNDYNGNPIDYLKDGTRSLVSYMRKLTNEKDFKNRFLSLVHYMSNLPQDKRITLLAQLSQLGHYCPERKYIDMNLLYDTYIDTIESRSLSNKLLELLHQDRMQILDQILAFMNQLKPFLNTMANLDREHLFCHENIHAIENQLRQLGANEEELPLMSRWLLDISSNRDAASWRSKICNNLLSLFIRWATPLLPPMEDVHFANLFKNILAPYLYVHHKSIDVLTTEDKSVIEKWITDLIYKFHIRAAKQIFSEQYTPHTVFKRVRDIINREPIIALSEIQEWFIEQYKNSHPESTANEAITWFREKIYDDNGLIRPRYLLFFLVNQGVLELTEDTQSKKDIGALTCLPV